MSTYDELGGHAGLAHVVGDFYARLAADPEISSFFGEDSDVDAPRLRAHLVTFLAAVLGGPDGYAGRDLVAVHAPLAITDTDFDAFIAHFVDTLNAHGASDETVGDIGRVIAGLRAAIVTTHAHRQQHRPAPAPVRVTPSGAAGIPGSPAVGSRDAGQFGPGRFGPGEFSPERFNPRRGDSRA